MNFSSSRRFVVSCTSRGYCWQTSDTSVVCAPHHPPIGTLSIRTRNRASPSSCPQIQYTHISAVPAAHFELDTETLRPAINVKRSIPPAQMVWHQLSGELHRVHRRWQENCWHQSTSRKDAGCPSQDFFLWCAPGHGDWVMKVITLTRTHNGNSPTRPWEDRCHVAERAWCRGCWQPFCWFAKVLSLSSKIQLRLGFLYVSLIQQSVPLRFYFQRQKTDELNSFEITGKRTNVRYLLLIGCVDCLDPFQSWFPSLFVTLYKLNTADKRTDWQSVGGLTDRQTDRLTDWQTDAWRSWCRD